MDLKNVIILFIIAIVGIVFLGVIADKTYESTSSALTNVTNTTHTWSASIVNDSFEMDTAADVSKWTITGATLYSHWGNLQTMNETLLTEGTDYNVTFSNAADTVVIQLMAGGGQDLSEDANETLAEYFNFAPEYVQGSSAARTILDLNKLWFVLGIFMLVIAIVWTQLRKNDLI